VVLAFAFREQPGTPKPRAAGAARRTGKDACDHVHILSISRLRRLNSREAGGLAFVHDMLSRESVRHRIQRERNSISCSCRMPHGQGPMWHACANGFGDDSGKMMSPTDRRTGQPKGCPCAAHALIGSSSRGGNDHRSETNERDDQAEEG
jgi:hypothetical protein